MRISVGAAFLTTLVGSVLGVSACSDQSVAERGSPRTGAVTERIIGGSVDTTRPDVLLLQDDTLAGFRCTATLIAPNLIITARHCVGKRAVPANSTLCQGDATTNGAQSLPDYQGDAPAMPMYVSAKPGAPLLARGMTIYDDGSTTTCAHDIALIALDRSIPGITPSAIRRTALIEGEPLVPMGFGWTDVNATINATDRMRGTTTVLALGPLVYSFKPNGDPMAASELVAVATGEIAVQGVTMTGDSGGPAFDAAGAITAVVSRGYSNALYGPGTFTTLSAHLATIDAALAATGNAPDGGVDTLPEAGTPKPDAGVDAGNGDPGFGMTGTDAPDAGNAAAPTSSGTSGCAQAAGARSSPASGAAAIFALACGLLLARSRRRR